MDEVNLPGVTKRKGFLVSCEEEGVLKFFEADEEADADNYTAEHLSLHKEHRESLRRILGHVEITHNTPVPRGLQCPTCKAAIGMVHADSCDVARCLETGEQRALVAHLPVIHSNCEGCNAAIVGTFDAAFDLNWNHADASRDKDHNADASGLTGLHHCGQDVWTGFFPGEKEAQEYGIPQQHLGRLGHWDKDRVRWVLDDDWQAKMQQLGIGPRIS